MTSLIGASGEDFASVLRSLGYRMERRPKPAEPPAPALVAPAADATANAPEATAAVEVTTPSTDLPTIEAGVVSSEPSPSA